MSNDIMGSQLMEALHIEDVAIVQLGEALAKAKTSFEVGSVRYAAVRDMVWHRLGDPYQRPEAKQLLPSKGKYRFIGMAIGDAVMHVLVEEGSPIPLGIIALRLFEGGMRGEGGGFIDGRATNAALMTMVRTGQVNKIEMEEDGPTHYEPMPEPKEPEWEEVDED